jgi:hypothetical protein
VPAAVAVESRNVRIADESDDLPVRYCDDDESTSEPLGRVVYCAPRAFKRLALPGAEPWPSGNIGWDNRHMAPAALTYPGQDFHPHAMVGSLETGDASIGICVAHFGRVERLLVRENGTVEPGQPLFVYTERPPTRDEYDRLLERSYRTEDDARRLRNLGPVAAFLAALRRRAPW